MTGNIAPYLGLITSEHASQPIYLETVSIPLQGVADGINTLGGMVAAFDLDTAVGVQLDAIGRRVNAARIIGGITLDDTDYRGFLRAIVLANEWDGTIPGAYAVWAALWTGQDQRTLITDNQDMSYALALVGQIPGAVAIAILTGDYLHLKPAGVRISGYAIPTVPDVPLFGLDIENANVAGMDVGAWAQFL